MFKKSLLLIISALLFAAGALVMTGFVTAESAADTAAVPSPEPSESAVVTVAVPSPEPPEAAPVHTAPQPTPEPPALVNTVKDKETLGTFRFRFDAKFLHIWFPNIANSDEAILIYDGEVWLIDCAERRSTVNGIRLMNILGIRHIDKLFNTHPHPDHLNGLEETNTSIPVRELLVCFPADVNDYMIKAMDYAASEGIAVRYYSHGDTFGMGDGRVTLKSYCPDSEDLDMNNNSALMMVQYGSRRMLFAADMERKGQEKIMSLVDPEELRAEILKYPHHGKSGLQDDFAAAVSPSFAIITNNYVDWGGVEYLSFRKIPFLFTYRDEVYTHLYTDGNVWVIEQIPVNQLEAVEPWQK